MSYCLTDTFSNGGLLQTIPLSFRWWFKNYPFDYVNLPKCRGNVRRLLPSHSCVLIGPSWFAWMALFFPVAECLLYSGLLHLPEVELILSYSAIALSLAAFPHTTHTNAYKCTQLYWKIYRVHFPRALFSHTHVQKDVYIYYVDM